MGELKLIDEDLALALAYEGKSFAYIAKALGFSNDMAFFKYRQTHPLFENSLKDARVQACEAMEDRVLGLADEYEDIKRAELTFKQIQWLCTVRNPAKYGPKLDLHVTQTLDITAALDASRRRLERLVAPVSLNASDSEDLW